MCFPDFQTYRRLWSETAPSITAAGIEVWVVGPQGSVEVLG